MCEPVPELLLAVLAGSDALFSCHEPLRCLEDTRMRVAKHKFAPIPECDDSSSGRLKVSQKVICADASDCLLPSESGDGFHDAHDNIQKPSHEQQVKKGECETANEQKCDDSPSSEHGFLVSLTFAGCTLYHPLPRARVA